MNQQWIQDVYTRANKATLSGVMSKAVGNNWDMF